MRGSGPTKMWINKKEAQKSSRKILSGKYKVNELKSDERNKFIELKINCANHGIEIDFTKIKIRFLLGNDILIEKQ